MKKEKYDPDDPLSRVRIDLKYGEKLMCHNDYNSRLNYAMFQVYGVVFGIIGTTFMPRNLIMPIRLVPIYIGALVGIGIDMRRIESVCNVSRYLMPKIFEKF